MKYLLDMDGVIVDFIGGVGRLFDADLSNITEWLRPEDLGLTTSEFWNAIDDKGMGFWEDLDELPWTQELIDLLGKDNFVISTSPSFSPESVYGKVRWLKRRFGYNFKNYMIGEHKHLMAKSGLVLIDDYESNVEKFREAGGDAIMFPQLWNYNAILVPDRVAHVKRVLDVVRKLS